MNQVKQIHGYTLRNGIDNTKIIIEKLLEIRNLNYAHVVFQHAPKPTLFLYNKLIQAYSSHGQNQHQCFSLYSQMRLHGYPPNQHTFNFLFSACTSLSTLSLGQMLHAHFIKSGFEPDVFAATALLDMYAKLGTLGLARQLFDEMAVREIPTWNAMMAGYARFGDMEGALELFRLMPSRNVVSWTAMISGYSQNKQYEKALGLFLRMEQETEIMPNEVTLASILPACANLGALEIGQRIEAYARKHGFFKNLYVSNAILEMYAKCGKIDVAWRVFDEIGSSRNLCSWNSMIMGLAVHGQCRKALELYDQMLKEGISPDDVTFVGLLLACTHGGMVEKGRHIFKSMATCFHIIPKLEHYGCMVDLLGRAGQLSEAYEVIQSMPMKPDSVIWGALLGACSFHGNIELAEIAAESLFALEPWNPGNYVILSNIYASAGQWDGVAKLRKVMKGSQITKAAGHSFIEEGGQLHKFIVEDRSHPQSYEIFALLDGVYEMIKLNRSAFECPLDLDLSD
ncbi:pentatricopeptide repeat-containing protein At5g08510 [Gastrolobium bilobum]|uniref:pentatricopeptide repeat-containing protein At5g08510 n=1 Tax=Gastrolobium bilobum TaxID=150636 RepID=UPI002AB1ABAF|nr:pentatricopeptide repeat-containing protein At5g08510 [Gastrolobium bilobum]